VQQAEHGLAAQTAKPLSCLGKTQIRTGLAAMTTAARAWLRPGGV